MRIKSLNIKNFKSIADITLVEPNPFTVFIGSNGAGKSNIFEALEYVNLSISKTNNISVNGLFGGHQAILPQNFDSTKDGFYFDCIFNSNAEMTFFRSIYESPPKYIQSTNFHPGGFNTPNNKDWKEDNIDLNKALTILYSNFSRIFISDKKDLKMNIIDDARLNSKATNLEKVLKRILKNSEIKEELIDWLTLFVPELNSIDIHSDNITGNDSLLVYEKHSKKPFDKSLISDGTFNIIAILTAVFQSDEPQFLCIEEPENGLNPYVAKELVTLFRNQCEEKGHYIWLNTHSQSLVSQLKPEEIILVDKKEGKTQLKQLKEEKLYGLTMDEAWLSNALGGGLPW